MPLEEPTVSTPMAMRRCFCPEAPLGGCKRSSYAMRGRQGTKTSPFGTAPPHIVVVDPSAGASSAVMIRFSVGLR